MIIAVIAIVFGLFTIKSGGAVLFVDGMAREARAKGIIRSVLCLWLMERKFIEASGGKIWNRVTTYVEGVLVWPATALALCPFQGSK